jgi:DNA-binding SARP family transcriptional activator/tetratricopeptide (TPR) repeat protein
MASLQLTLLGGFQARIGSGPALPLRTRKAQALLAYLALSAGRAHPRDKLATLLWGNSPEGQARNSLRQALFALRRALPAGGVRVEGDAVAVDPATVEVDVAAFERGVAEGTSAALEAAVPLYQGDLLAGLSVEGAAGFEEWLLGERERLRELALEGLAKLLAHQRSAARTEPAIQTGLKLSSLDPLQEPVHRTLMRLYAQTGRRGAALRQYQQCVGALQRELGVEPEAETKQLYQEIIRRRDEAPSSRTALGKAGQELTRRAPLGSRPEAVTTETSLIGRDVELATLRNALAEAGGGRGRAVAVLGEAGVGKTRLLVEVATEARQGGSHVLFGRAYESAQILPFGPWVDAFRTGGLITEEVMVSGLNPVWRAELARLFPELAGPGLPAPSDDYLRLFESVAYLVAHVAATQPLALMLEDLHWADEMSLRLLSFLGRRVKAWPVLVVATAREEELADADTLRRVLGELRGEGHFGELLLSPLSRADTSRLVRCLTVAGSDAGTVAWLEEQAWAASEGNPFVVVETVRALREGLTLQEPATLSLPQRVRDVIAGRVARLSEGSRQLLSVAAVIGREFDFALLQRASRVPDRDAAEGVEELVRRRMLHGVDEAFDFTHDRIREVVYGGLLPPRRKLLHGDVAVALDALTAGALDPPAGALGRHYRHAEVWDKAVFHLREAGLKALARSSNREAVAYFEQALAALSHLPETRETLEQAVDLRFDLRTSLFPLGEVRSILGHLREAERLARRLDDQRRIGRVSVYMSHLLHATGRPNEAREFGQRARVIAEALGDLAIKVGATFYIGASCYFMGDYGTGHDFLQETVQSLEGDLGRERYGLVGLPAVMARTYLTWIHAERGEFEAALVQGRDGVRLAEAVDHPYSLIIACWGLLYLHAGRQELGEVDQLSKRALALARQWDIPLPSAITTGIVGHAYALAGRIADGLGLLEESVRLHELSGLVYYHSLIVAYLAEAYLLADRPDDALVFGEQALGLARKRGERGFEAWCLRTLGEIAAHADPPHVERAQGRYREALALATELRMRPLAAHCHLGLGTLYRRTGIRAKAEEHLNSASTMYREMNMGFRLAQAEAAMTE